MANNEMTNGQKAREIANCNKCPYNRHHCKHNKDTWCHEYRMALEMAQWKDGQMLSIIEDKLDYARKMIKENNGKSVRLKYEGMRKILIELKNELKVKCEV